MSVQRNRLIAIGVIAIIVIAVGVYAYYATLTTVRLVLKDPPAQSSTYGATHIWVSFSSIEVHQVRSGGSGPWITIKSDTNITIDLVAIITTPETLGTFSIPAGNYTEIRFNVTSASAEIAGIWKPLDFSGSNVLDAHFPGQLVLSTGQSATITSDFTADNTSLLSGHLTASLTASLS